MDALGLAKWWLTTLKKKYDTEQGYRDGDHQILVGRKDDSCKASFITVCRSGSFWEMDNWQGYAAVHMLKKCGNPDLVDKAIGMVWWAAVELEMTYTDQFREGLSLDAEIHPLDSQDSLDASRCLIL